MAFQKKRMSLDLGGYRRVFTDLDLFVHSDATNNASTLAKTITVDIPSLSDYLLTLSFSYNNDSANSDIIVYATFGGNALDLNDRNADPQGQFQILRAEVKDQAAGAGGNITGTGSGQKYPFSCQYLMQNIASGDTDLVISVGSETANVESAIWNVILKVEELI